MLLSGSAPGGRGLIASWISGCERDINLALYSPQPSASTTTLPVALKVTLALTRLVAKDEVDEVDAIDKSGPEIEISRALRKRSRRISRAVVMMRCSLMIERCEVETCCYVDTGVRNHREVMSSFVSYIGSIDAWRSRANDTGQLIGYSGGVTPLGPAPLPPFSDPAGSNRIRPLPPLTGRADTRAEGQPKLKLSSLEVVVNYKLQGCSSKPRILKCCALRVFSMIYILRPVNSTNH